MLKLKAHCLSQYHFISWALLPQYLVELTPDGLTRNNLPLVPRELLVLRPLEPPDHFDFSLPDFLLT